MNLAILALTLTTSLAPHPDSAAGDLSLRLNLPERRLEVLEGTREIESYPVAIGMVGHETPTGSYSVKEITWNPWWHPPESPWAKDAHDTPPGAGNPMGRVKLRFDRLLYLHGTPDEKSLGRAASHGCVRMANEDAMALARLLAEGTGALSAAKIDRLEASLRRTRTVTLPGEGVPLLIEYRLVEETDGGVERHEDVYHLGLEPYEKWLLDHAGQGADGAGERARRDDGASDEDGPGLAVSERWSISKRSHPEDPMDRRTYGPEIYPHASVLRKRWAERLDRLPAPPEPIRLASRVEEPKPRSKRA